MRKKRLHYVSLGVLAVFLFSLLFVMSWTNPLVVDGGARVSPFFGISPFIIGFLVMVVVFILILLAVEEKS